MKKLLPVLFALTFLYSASAQDLSSAVLIGHYTLLDTDADDTGNYGPVTRTNAPFMGADGVYSFGGYLFDVVNVDSSLVQTPDLDALNEESFAVQLEIKLDTLDSRPIVVLGEGWRYLGMGINFDSTIVALHNGIYRETASDKLEIDRWYEITMVHTKADETSKYYLDRKLIFTHVGALDYPGTDLDISNSHFGHGTAFRGFWRNLKVYTGDLTSNTGELKFQSKIQVFPNPAHSKLFLSGDFPAQMSFRIFNNYGSLVQKGVLSDPEIDLSNLQKGMYMIRFESSHGYVLNKTVLKF